MGNDVAVFLVVGLLRSIDSDLLLLVGVVGDSKLCSCFSVVWCSRGIFFVVDSELISVGFVVSSVVSLFSTLSLVGCCCGSTSESIVCG